MSPPANPRARVGHDFGGRFATSGLEISIRAPAWGATSEAQRRALPERVSIRAPAWGATCIVWMASTMLSFQSTRPRGARPSPWNVRPCPLLFQSTRPRGARHISPSADLTGSVFQSTCPRGARRDEAGVLQHESLVSIHAPAWGATRRSPRCRPRCRCFNPRARVGRDLMAARNCSVSALFQSTRPRGARHGTRFP